MSWEPTGCERLKVKQPCLRVVLCCVRTEQKWWNSLQIPVSCSNFETGSVGWRLVLAGGNQCGVEMSWICAGSKYVRLIVLLYDDICEARAMAPSFVGSFVVFVMTSMDG